MAYMQWTEAMSVGLPELDDDHRILIAVINRLAADTGEGAAADVVGRSLVTLTRYAEYHFEREQRVMEACGFPELDSHIEEHREFVGWVREAERRYDTTPADTAAELHGEVLAFLKNWLNHHILLQDMAYRAYLQDAMADARRAAL